MIILYNDNSEIRSSTSSSGKNNLHKLRIFFVHLISLYTHDSFYSEPIGGMPEIKKNEFFDTSTKIFEKE